MPERIDHSWRVDDPEQVTLLDEANRLLDELNAFPQLVPDVDFFIKMHVAKEATTSCRIEGTQADREDVLVDVPDVDSERKNVWEEVENWGLTPIYASEKERIWVIGIILRNYSIRTS